MSGAVECPIFRPSIEEFRNFDKFLSKIAEPLEKNGMCKVVPPKDWTWPIVELDKLDDLKIRNPIKQVVSGRTGVYSIDNVLKTNMTVAQYRKLASKPIHQIPTRCLDGDKTDPLKIALPAAQRSYWKSMTTTAECPVYGADVLGSVFKDEDVPWNVSKLDCLLRESGIDIPGVTVPMLYVGMWRATFSLHNEDMNLFSINYLHAGAPKVWYAIPPEQNKRVESLAQSLWPDEAITCKDFLRHKTKLLSPQRLNQNGIKYTTCLHNAGEFMITMASSYHFGFNCGFNVAESLNFVNPSLLDLYLKYGREAKPCVCRPGSVRIDLDVFEEHARRSLNTPDSQQAVPDSCGEKENTEHTVTDPKPKLKRTATDGLNESLNVKKLKSYGKLATIKNVVGKHGFMTCDDGKVANVIIRSREGNQVRVHVCGTKRENDIWLKYPNKVLTVPLQIK